MSAYAAAVFLCCVVFCLHEVNGKCNSELVNKIKALNVPDYPHILDKLDGEYVVIYVDGIPTDTLQNDCSRVRFSKFGSSRMIEYEKIVDGDEYPLEKKHGTFVHAQNLRTPEIVYYPIVSSPEVFAVHICDDSENEEAAKKYRPGYTPIAMTYIAVRVDKTLLGLSSKINAAKELVKSVGVQAGQDLYGCFKAIPAPQEGAAVGPLTEGKQCFLQRNFYYYMDCLPMPEEETEQN